MPRGQAGKLTAAAGAFYRKTEGGNAFAQILAAAAENETHEIWPENWQSWVLFMKLGTQWNFGPGGRTGLHYEAAYPLLDRMGLSPQEWDEMFEDLRAMERAGLAAMYPG